MRVHYVYCHPLPESFHAAIRGEALAGLKEAGHAVDLCDLYAEKFDPVMSEPTSGATITICRRTSRASPTMCAGCARPTR